MGVSGGGGGGGKKMLRCEFPVPSIPLSENDRS